MMDESLRGLLAAVPPRRPAVRYEDGRVAGYGELAEAADRIAEGVTAGGTVGLCLSDPVAVTAWATGLLSRGTSVFLTHPELPAAELGALAAHERATAVVTGPDRVPQGFTPSAAPLSVAGEVLARRDGPGEHGLRYPGPTLHCYTSGTSGRRKGAVRPEPTLVHEGRSVSATFGFGEETRVLCAVPLCHAYGFAVGVLAVLAAGATLTAFRPNSPRQLAQALRRSEADVLVGVPVLYDLWTRGTVPEPRAHRLRRCVSAGAALPARTARDFAEQWGVRISQQYGMTECGAISVDLAGDETASCVGRPFPGVQVRVDPSGEIVVVSAYAATGYVAGVEHRLPVNPFTPDGLLTGDLGSIDELGRLHVTGRRKEIINVHGETVDPAEVEEVLRTCAGVSDAAVAGVPAAGGDQWVAAFVVCGAEVSEGQVTAHCAERLVGYKVPKRVVRLPELPRTPLGKIRRAELVDLLPL